MGPQLRFMAHQRNTFKFNPACLFLSSFNNYLLRTDCIPDLTGL